MTAPNTPLTTILSATLALYRFAGAWGADSRCGVRVLSLYGRPTVILSELPDNPGTSVTNRAELIATRLLSDRLSGQAPAEIRWIEHYPPAEGQFRNETFDWIDLDYSRAARCYTNARWRRLTPAEIEDLRTALIQEAH